MQVFIGYFNIMTEMLGANVGGMFMRTFTLMFLQYASLCRYLGTTTDLLKAFSIYLEKRIL